MTRPARGEAEAGSRLHGVTALWLLGCLILAGCAPHPAGPGAATPQVTVGSKKFTESVLLGEIATLLAESAGAAVRHERELGGSQLLFQALLQGEIDVYPEYTGTLREEILAGEKLGSDEEVERALARRGIEMSRPLGFSNNYALGMRKDLARKRGIRTISDLVRHPDLALGFSNEFMDRADGWPGLRAHYRLPHPDVRGLDHDLAYRGLVQGTLAVTDLYTTDAEIREYDLALLADDTGYFTTYQAVLLLRTDLRERAPGAHASLLRLEGALDEEQMIELNARARIDGQPETRVAADFVLDRFGVETRLDEVTWTGRLLRHTGEHLTLVGISLLAAILVAIPLGIASARRPRLGQIILGTVGIIQTIPSLALLVFMIPLLGIGGPPAVVALFLYSLLPIVRNTYTGLKDIAPSLLLSADAMGLSRGARLRLVELPLAARSILAGIKTSAVINVGTATLGALIGAGGYGQPILTGIRRSDTELILLGAVPAAVLALLVQGLFELLDRALVSRGLRLREK